MTTESTIFTNSNIFNFEKTDYTEGSLFFGQTSGLFDTINVHYPVLERYYKRMKSLDWDELEFNFEPCRLEFDKMTKLQSQPMINQIGWQWETDSVAARCIAPVMAGFLTNQTAMDMYQAISLNEVVHARAYSEIVKFSFADPATVMNEVLGVKEHKQRLSLVSRVFAEAFTASHELSLGLRKRDQATFEIFFRFIVALFLMERGQFMSSFPITFTYGEHDKLIPICKAVQKICQDEYEVHAMAGAAMIDILRDTSEGVTAMWNNREIISKMYYEVRNMEIANLDFLLCGQPSLFGVTQRDYGKWVDFCFGDIATVLNIKPTFDVPKSNPISFMNKWVNISSIQAALQEEKNGQYLLGMVRRDDMGKSFDVPGITD